MDVHRLRSGPDRDCGLGGEFGGRDRHGRVISLTAPAETSLDPLEPLSHRIMLASRTPAANWGTSTRRAADQGRPRLASPRDGRLAKSVAKPPSLNKIVCAIAGARSSWLLAGQEAGDDR